MKRNVSKQYIISKCFWKFLAGISFQLGYGSIGFVFGFAHAYNFCYFEPSSLCCDIFRIYVHILNEFTSCDTNILSHLLLKIGKK